MVVNTLGPVNQKLGPIEDRFIKFETIGSGAYGVVYKAMDRRNQSIVALKKVKLHHNDTDGIPSSSLREIGILKDLKHPNVVRLLDVQMCPTSIYLVFEHLELDLKKLLNKYKDGLQPLLVKHYMWQLLQGLAYCHAHRVLHRDLKLQNLLVDRVGNIKLADFGLARSIGLPIRTYTHEVVTLWYRAPELLLKTDYYGPSVDIWSLGCIFAEMLTNRTLFTGESEIDQLYRIFRSLGTPNEDSWPGFSDTQEASYFSDFKGRGVDSYIGDKDPLATDLLTKFLAYNPATRISAKQALAHEYLDGAGDIDRSKLKIIS